LSGFTIVIVSLIDPYYCESCVTNYIGIVIVTGLVQ